MFSPQSFPCLFATFFRSKFTLIITAAAWLLVFSGWGAETKAATLTVNAGGDFQAALNNAQCGDTVVLEAGASFRGPFDLPLKNCTDYVTIQSSRLGEMPEGTRVTPAQATLMPRLTSPAYSYAVRAIHGAHHYRFLGVEFTTADQTAFSYHLIVLGWFGADQDTLAEVPHHLTFDRCYVHAFDGQSVVRGFLLNSAHTDITNSYVSNFKGRGMDTQAIGGNNGPGPYLIENNFLEAAGENIIFGGDDTSIPNLVPSDIVIRRNHLFKPLAWRAEGWTVKNLFELKNARRVVVDGNTFENNWGQAQTGEAILFTVRNQSGGNPWATVDDVKFTNNVVRNVGGGINILGQDYYYTSLKTRNLLIANNLFVIDGPSLAGRGQFVMMTSGAENVRIDHNTVLHTGTVAMLGPAPHLGVQFTNNVSAHNEYGIFGDGVGEGMAAILTYWPGGTFAGNIIAGANPLLYPAGNSYPTVPLSELLTTSFELRTPVPGTDGKTVGVDFAALQAAQAGGTPTRLDNPQDFAAQHYRDFLGREPDAAGLSHWTSEITSCGSDAACTEVRRVNVSAAFYFSIEFQQTGYLVYRTYGAAFGTTRIGSTVPLTFSEFLPDVRRIAQSIVVGTGNWQAQLEANKAAYFDEFVSRGAFTSAYLSLTPAQFVDALNANAGGSLSTTERNQLVSDLSAGTKTRAQVLRTVAEDADFAAAQFNSAFVLMEYFGYLRRDPDPVGYDHWLAKLEQFGGDFQQAEMVRAFLDSAEYRQRFAR